MGALAQWGRVRVSDQRRLQVELVVVEELPGEPRDELTGVALTGHIEVFLLQLGEGVPEVPHESHELGRHFFQVCKQGLAVRETCTYWLVDVDHSC